MESLLAALMAGIGSVWIAAAVSVLGAGKSISTFHTRPGLHDLASLAVGALLAAVFVDLLPEAFNREAAERELFASLLSAIVFLFLVDRAQLQHYGLGRWQDYERSRAHCPGDRPPQPPPWVRQRGCGSRGRVGHLLLEGFHAFCGGVVIASAFAANSRIGWISACAVLAQNVHHYLESLDVARRFPTSRGSLIATASLGATAAPLGAVACWGLVERFEGALPFLLAVASGTLIYVAVTGLIPRLQQRLDTRGTLRQIAWLSGGIACVTAFSLVVQHH